MFLKPIYIALFVFTISSCNSIKEKPIQKPVELTPEGFTAGVIQKSTKKGDCLFTILVTSNSGEPLYFDPINLDEAYKKDGIALFFKYRPLRMMNRCQRANPVEIQELQIH
tara:strand:+ start:187 stop:519 length:333 start_codon:yes stop_codon:yes gene_type:complete